MDQAMLMMLMDREKISEMIYKYMNGVDAHDWQTCRSLFLDEFDADIMMLGEESRMRITADEWIEGIRAICSQYKSMQHMSANHIITFNGDDASCLSSLQVRLYLPDINGGDFLTWGGLCTHGFKRTADGWKICAYKVKSTWSDGNIGVQTEATRRAMAG